MTGAPWRSRYALTRRVGPLVVTSGFVGTESASTGGGASANAYADLVAALWVHGIAPTGVVRLDHFTASQGWLVERQRARADVFGRPARLASTGIATRQPLGELLTVAAMALSKAEPLLQASGADHGMPAIAAAVRGGALLFVSGVLTDGTGEPAAQCEACLSGIAALLAQAGASGDGLIRLDAFAGDEETHAGLMAAIGARWPIAGLPIGGGCGAFDRPGQIEVNALAIIDRPVDRGISGPVGWSRAEGLIVAGPYTASDAASVESWCRQFVGWLLALCDRQRVTAEAVARIELRCDAPYARDGIAAMLSSVLPVACRPAFLYWSAPGPMAAIVLIDGGEWPA